MYSQIFTSGSKYKEDHKTIVIFLVDDKNNKGRTYEKIQFKNEYNDEYDMQVIYKINIPKYIKDFKPKDENDKILIEALSVLISTDFKKYVKSNNNVIRKVADEIMKLNSDDYARIEMELYKAQQLHDRLDREAAIKEAAEKAAKEATEKATKETTEKVQIETIKSMNSNGIDIEKISTILKLDIEYVKEVLNK